MAYAVGAGDNGMTKHCSYCQVEVPLLNHGDAGYPYYSDYGPTYVCVPCGAWVGCHKGTTRALGGLANAELRAAKVAAHAVFDPLWQGKIRRDKCSKTVARRAGYKWLSEQLQIPVKKTHIGYMSLEECKKVIEVCGKFRKSA